MNLHIAEPRDFPINPLMEVLEATDLVVDPSRANAEVLWVRLRDYIGRDYLGHFPSVQTIVSPTTGLNHIDLEECERRGITVLSLAGEVDFLREIRSTAELTIGLMLSLLRKIPAAVESVKRGEWDRDKFKGRDLAGKGVAVIGAPREGELTRKQINRASRDVTNRYEFGCGRIAQQVVDLLVAFQAKVCLIDRKEWRPDHPWFAECDILTLHANYTPENDKMCDAEFFAAMKPGALFINTARGELVDEGDLLEALCCGQVGGAALDVLADEQNHSIKAGMIGLVTNAPMTLHDQLIQYARGHDNLIITPHIGGCTHESMEKAEIFMAHKLLAHLEAPIASG